jgi:hypothetical protein
MAIFLKLSSFIGFPPLWFGLGASYPKSALRVTDVLAQKLTLRVTYVLAHPGNRCAGTWQLGDRPSTNDIGGIASIVTFREYHQNRKGRKQWGHPLKGTLTIDKIDK